MESSNQTVSPLRQRMIEDMRMRKLAEKTQVAYIRAVRKFAAYLKRSPDTATVEELRRFQLHLIDHGTSPGTLNATLSGLKFFFDITLDRGELMAKMQPVRVPRTLPVVLSRDEVARLIAAAPNLKSQTALSIRCGRVRGVTPPVCVTTIDTPASATTCANSGSAPPQASLMTSAPTAMTASATDARQVSTEMIRSGCSSRTAATKSTTLSLSSASPISTPGAALIPPMSTRSAPTCS